MTIVTAAIITCIADVRGLEKFRTYFRLEPVTVLSALSALKRTYSLGAHWSRALGRIIEYAFIPELASASGRLPAVIAQMSTDLSAY